MGSDCDIHMTCRTTDRGHQERRATREDKANFADTAPADPRQGEREELRNDARGDDLQQANRGHRRHTSDEVASNALHRTSIKAHCAHFIVNAHTEQDETMPSPDTSRRKRCELTASAV